MLRSLSQLVRPHHAVLALAPLLAASGARAQEVDTLAIRAHSYFLAQDELGGREPGSVGERLAARYLVATMSRLGLAPAGTDGYEQPVPLAELRLDLGATRLTWEGPSGERAFVYGTDFVLRPGGPGAYRSLAGPLLFLDDLDTAGPGGDVRDRVLVSTEPVPPGELTRLEQGGALGVLLLVRDPSVFVRERGRSLSGRKLLNARVHAPVWQPSLPVLVAGPALSAAVLANRRPGPAAAPAQRITLQLAARFRPIEASNVAGLLVGTDPRRRDEFVVYTAHYDHLGRTSTGPDSIFNGFSDNAAGVAMVLAIAEAMRTAPPARSVLFLFPTGEESGLLGATWFAHAPTVPLDAVAAVINIDAGAPPAPPLEWEIAGGAASTLGRTARRIAETEGWTVRLTDPRPNSDYWPFALRGVPAIFPIPGPAWEGVDAAEKERLVERWERYHRPDDEWAPDFPLAGLLRYARFALEIGLAAANDDGRPRRRTGDGR